MDWRSRLKKMNTLASLRNLLARMGFGALINSKYQILSCSFFFLLSGSWRRGEKRSRQTLSTHSHPWDFIMSYREIFSKQLALNFPEAIMQPKPELEVLPDTCVIVTLAFPKPIPAQQLLNIGRGRSGEPEFWAHLSEGAGPLMQAGLSQNTGTRQAPESITA